MKDKVLEIISKSDWTVVKDQDNIKMLQIQNGSEKINIYWGTMTVFFPHKNESVVNCKLETLRKHLGVRKGLFSRVREFLY